MDRDRRYRVAVGVAVVLALTVGRGGIATHGPVRADAYVDVFNRSDEPDVR